MPSCGVVASVAVDGDAAPEAAAAVAVGARPRPAMPETATGIPIPYGLTKRPACAFVYPSSSGQERNETSRAAFAVRVGAAAPGPAAMPAATATRAVIATA